MKPLAKLIDTFRTQSAQIMETMQAINRLVSVEVSTSHSKRIEVIQHIVADHYGIPPEAMHSKTRTESWARARQIAMFLARELTTFSLQDIAQAFRPDMDHKTVMHGRDKIMDLMAQDKILALTVAKLREKAERGIESISMPLFAYAKSKQTDTTTP